MRTTVYTDADDLDAIDEWPDCHGSVDEDGVLGIVNFDTSDVETVYGPDEWAAFETTRI